MKTMELARHGKDDGIGTAKFPRDKRRRLYYRSGNKYEILASGLTDEQCKRLTEILIDFMGPQILKGDEQ